jgi:hypothetical protein
MRACYADAAPVRQPPSSRAPRLRAVTALADPGSLNVDFNQSVAKEALTISFSAEYSQFIHSGVRGGRVGLASPPAPRCSLSRAGPWLNEGCVRQILPCVAVLSDAREHRARIDAGGLSASPMTDPIGLETPCQAGYLCLRFAPGCRSSPGLDRRLLK